MINLALLIASAVVVMWAACAVLELVGVFVGACADAVLEDGKSIQDRELEDLTSERRLHWRNQHGL